MIIYGYILKYLGVLGLWPILIQIVKYNYHLNGPWVPAYSVLPVYKKSRFYFTWFERIFPFFKQTEPDYYYYLSFGVFLLTAIVKYNWLKTWGNFSRSTYGCLNSVPIEINGIISVVSPGAELSQHWLLFKVASWKFVLQCVIEAGVFQKMSTHWGHFELWWRKRSWKKSILNAQSSKACAEPEHCLLGKLGSYFNAKK